MTLREGLHRRRSCGEITTSFSHDPIRHACSRLSALGDARLLVYEGVGHAVHWELPDRVARDVTAFVSDLRE